MLRFLKVKITHSERGRVIKYFYDNEIFLIKNLKGRSKENRARAGWAVANWQ